GELKHHQVKHHYVCTNKRLSFPLQIAKHQQQECLIRKIREHNKNKGAIGASLYIPFKDSDSLPPTSPNAHYHVSQSKKYHINVAEWLGNNCNNPALQDFLPKLQDHVLARLDSQNGLTQHSNAWCNTIIFSHNHLYLHKYLHINFMTYDA
ncbi:hypothetical protein P691DRAFT_682992, partial [Macrolepiota fuliginosa MF-IS2]